MKRSVVLTIAYQEDEFGDFDAVIGSDEKFTMDDVMNISSLLYNEAARIKETHGNIDLREAPTVDKRSAADRGDKYDIS